MSIDFLHKKMENERKDLMCPIHHPQDVNGRTISDMHTNPTKSYVIFRKGIIQFYNFTNNKSYQ
jgi:hypothetical protein